MSLHRSDWIIVGLLALAVVAGAYRYWVKSEEKPAPTAPAARAAPAPAVQPITTELVAALSQASQRTAVPVAAAEFPPIVNPYLTHAFVVTEKVSAGAHPDGDAAFKALSEMGVKTIISVDGAKPNVEAARKYGMRYVHLPVTYGNITPQQGKEIAKAINEMPGRIYLHCPQGINRSAAAVAMGCVMNGSIKTDQVETLMATFGTTANYKGLLASARAARPVDPDELKQMKVEFVETQSVTEMADGMVAIDHNWENLKRFQKSKWAPVPEHSELDYTHEAQQLREHFAAFGRLESAQSKSEDFQTKLLTAQEVTQLLCDTLAAKPFDTQAADTAVNRVGLWCAMCHKFYRD